MAQDSNVVEVLLPFWDNVEKAVQIMQRFGEVGGVNVLNSEEGLLEVAYWDVRAAQKAVDEMAPKCWKTAPCGNRKVRLPGSASLDSAVVEKISDMYVDEADGRPEVYTLVFFDVRDAHHYASTVDWESSEDLRREWAEPAGPHAKRATSANSWAANEKHSRSQWRDAKWADEGIMTSIAEEDETSEQESQPAPGSYSVLLRGIPPELLNKTCVDAILEQAGLAKDVLHCTLSKSLAPGSCLLLIYGQEAVCRCLNHFAGCRWGASASLLSGVPKHFSEAEPPSEFGAAHDWLIDDPAVNAVIPRWPKMPKEGAMPTSEASTDLSESDDEITKLQGRAHHLWYSQAC